LNRAGLEGPRGFHSYRRWVTIYRKELKKRKKITHWSAISTNLRRFPGNSDEVRSFSIAMEASATTLTVVGTTPLGAMRRESLRFGIMA
jgi:hypothetical protein